MQLELVECWKLLECLKLLEAAPPTLWGAGYSRSLEGLKLLEAGNREARRAGPAPGSEGAS
eukprot:12253179-Alexandrium_andersonii.AAC.1